MDIFQSANGFRTGFAFFCISMLQLVGAGAGLEAVAAHEDHSAHHAAVAVRNVVRTMQEYPIPDVELTGADGLPISLRRELGTDTPVMLNFIFTTCTAICPVMSATFSNVQQELGADRGKLRTVSISIDPENDTPDTLRKYAQRFKAGPEWKLLTGKPGDIVAVQRAFDVYRGSKMNHAPVTFIRASADQPWTRLEGFASAAELVAEYRKMTQ